MQHFQHRNQYKPRFTVSEILKESVFSNDAFHIEGFSVYEADLRPQKSELAQIFEELDEERELRLARNLK